MQHEYRNDDHQVFPLPFSRIATSDRASIIILPLLATDIQLIFHYQSFECKNNQQQQSSRDYKSVGTKWTPLHIGQCGFGGTARRHKNIWRLWCDMTFGNSSKICINFLIQHESSCIPRRQLSVGSYLLAQSIIVVYFALCRSLRLF